MAQLAVESQDVTKSDAERADYQKEFSTLSGYITDAMSKNFNGVSLFGATGLNVTTDADGGAFFMTGVQGNYLTGATQQSQQSQSNQLTASTPLSDIVAGFTGGTMDTYYMDIHGHGHHNNPTISGNSTIQDLIDAVSSADSGISGSFDASTGQLSFTLDAGNWLTENPGTTLLEDLGLPSLTANTSGSSETISTTLSLPSSPPAPTQSLDISTTTGAAMALTTVTSAIQQLAGDRATVGANLERLSYTSNELGVLGNNLAAANSQLVDVDVAQESTSFAKFQILVQSGTAMLAQANMSPQSILKLLG